MKNRSYYSFSDITGNNFNRCSIESCEAPLIVNCAGQLHSTFPLTTDKREGRLDYYLMYLISGELSVKFPEGERRVIAGQAMIFPPRYHYKYSFAGGELSYYWCHFTGSDAAALLSELGFSELPLCLELSGGAGFPERFEKILSAFSESDKLRRRALSHALEGVIFAMARIASGGEKKPLSRSLSYINEAYTKDIRIPELAKMENISPSRYNVLFREVTGMPPVKYIAKLRMQNACELLVSTDLAVKQIGMTVGYSDPHFFSKQFKLHMGASPAEYRENFTKNYRST